MTNRRLALFGDKCGGGCGGDKKKDDGCGGKKDKDGCGGKDKKSPCRDCPCKKKPEPSKKGATPLTDEDIQRILYSYHCDF